MGKRFLVWSGTALLIGTLAVTGCGKKEEPAPPPPAPAPAAPAGEPGAMAPAPETAPMSPGAPEEKKEERAKTP